MTELESGPGALYWFVPKGQDNGRPTLTAFFAVWVGMQGSILAGRIDMHLDVPVSGRHGPTPYGRRPAAASISSNCRRERLSMPTAASLPSRSKSNVRGRVSIPSRRPTSAPRSTSTGA
jgi:hypothetical protein